MGFNIFFLSKYLIDGCMHFTGDNDFLTFSLKAAKRHFADPPNCDFKMKCDSNGTTIRDYLMKYSPSKLLRLLSPICKSKTVRLD